MPERSGYGRSKLNATKHGVLSRHLLSRPPGVNHFVITNAQVASLDRT